FSFENLNRLCTGDSDACASGVSKNKEQIATNKATLRPDKTLFVILISLFLIITSLLALSTKQTIFIFRLCSKIICAIRAQICVRFVLKKSERYRDTLKIFLGKDDVKMSCEVYKLFYCRDLD
ncbi:MAG: hypothetical protein US57_C0021G0001, partial [Candidatus Moranbacteria bacterium GW2011_GWC2_37_73]